MKKAVAALVMIFILGCSNTIFAAEAWRDGYADFLKNPGKYQGLFDIPVPTFSKNDGFYLYDIDKNGLPELLMNVYGCTPYVLMYTNSVERAWSAGGGMEGSIRLPANTSLKGIFCDGKYVGISWCIIENGQFKSTAVCDRIFDGGGKETIFNQQLYSDWEKATEISYYEVSDANVQKVIYGWQSPSLPKTQTTKVIFQGKALNLPVINKNSKTFYPMRELLEGIGARVDWNSATKTAKGTLDDKTVEFTIGSSSYKANGQTLRIGEGVSAFTQDSKTYIPIREAAEALGYTVNWNPSTSTVTIR